MLTSNSDRETLRRSIVPLEFKAPPATMPPVPPQSHGISQDPRTLCCGSCSCWSILPSYIMDPIAVSLSQDLPLCNTTQWLQETHNVPEDSNGAMLADTRLALSPLAFDYTTATPHFEGDRHTGVGNAVILQNQYPIVDQHNSSPMEMPPLESYINEPIWLPLPQIASTPQGPDSCPSGPNPSVYDGTLTTPSFPMDVPLEQYSELDLALALMQDILWKDPSCSPPFSTPPAFETHSSHEVIEEESFGEFPHGGLAAPCYETELSLCSLDSWSPRSIETDSQLATDFMIESLEQQKCHGKDSSNHQCQYHPYTYTESDIVPDFFLWPQTAMAYLL